MWPWKKDLTPREQLAARLLDQASHLVDQASRLLDSPSSAPSSTGSPSSTPTTRPTGKIRTAEDVITLDRDRMLTLQAEAAHNRLPEQIRNPRLEPEPEPNPNPPTGPRSSSTSGREVSGGFSATTNASGKTVPKTVPTGPEN